MQRFSGKLGEREGNPEISICFKALRSVTWERRGSSASRHSRSSSSKREDIRQHAIDMRVRQTVCGILINNQAATGDQLVSRAPRQFQRHRLVDVTLQNKRRYLDRSKFSAEIGFVHDLEKIPEHLGRAAIQEHPTPPIDGLSRDGVLGNAKEVRRGLCGAMRKIVLEGLVDHLESLARPVPGIVIGLHAKRRRRRNQDSVRDPSALVGGRRHDLWKR